MPASVINELRRRVLEELENKLTSVKVHSFTDVDVPSTLKALQNKAVGNKNKVKFNVRVASVSRIPENLENVENLYIPLMTAENSVEKLKNLPVSVGIEVPRGIFGAEELVEKRLAMFKTHGL